MARKTKMEALETRGRLLDAAEGVFRQRGVTRTSLSEIAAAAGVTRGAVYWHFKDKAALFHAMCDRATLPLDELFRRASETATTDPLSTLRELCVGALQRLAADARTQVVFEVIFHKTELVDELAGIATSHQNDRCQCLVQIEAIIRRCAELGELPPEIDAALAAQGLNALMVGIMHEWVLDPSAYDLSAAAPALIDSFLAGLAIRPPLRAPRAMPRVRAKTTFA
jgi:TetR/AcrR family transcriptional regulator, acrAB operon repressor